MPIMKSLIDNLDGPEKWIKEEEVVFSKNFDVSELVKENLLFFEDMHKPIYCIAKIIIGAHLFIQSNDKVDAVENAEMLLKLLLISNDIKNRLQKDFQAYNQLFSVKVLNYVMDATKCQILYALNKFEETKKVFMDIKDFEFKGKFEIATKSAIISVLNLIICSDNNKSLTNMKEAFEMYPEGNFFVYRYAKSLNKFRKEQYGCRQQPSQTERDMLNRLRLAFKNSKDSKMGVLLTKLLWDYRFLEEAEEICLDLFEKKENCSDLSNLTSQLLRLKKLDEARECLDRLSILIPDSSKYLHNEGKYFEKIGDDKKAREFLKKAADLKNYPAARQYLSNLKKCGIQFDYIEYINNMLDTFGLSKESQQELLVDLAILHSLKNDAYKAVENFLQAIRMNPESPKLKRFWPLDHAKKQPAGGYIKQVNVYELAFDELKTINEIEIMDKKFKQIYQELRNECKNNLPYRCPQFRKR